MHGKEVLRFINTLSTIESKGTHFFSVRGRFRPRLSSNTPLKAPEASPEYVDPGSEEGKYEMVADGFLGSRLGADCCTETKEGGPGRISVERSGSLSRCGACKADTPGNSYARKVSEDVMVVIAPPASGLRSRQQ